MDVVSILFAALLLVVALGSCFPQRSVIIDTDPDRLASWERLIRVRYAGLAGALETIGAFQLFRSPLFLVLLGSLTLSTIICALDRWRAVWGRVFSRRVYCSNAMLDVAVHSQHLSLTPSTGPQIVRDCLELRGYRVRTAKVGETLHIRADRNRLAHLATLVSHLAVLLLIIGVVLSGIYGWREELFIGPDQVGQVGHTEGVTLNYEGFQIERYPDGSPADYVAEVRLVDASQRLARGHVRVNQPLVYGDFGIYLQGFARDEDGNMVTLLVVHDPGYILVVVSGLMLLLGMTVSFNFPHSCVYARLGPGGSLDIAGRPDRHNYDFDREFRELVDELALITEGNPSA